MILHQGTKPTFQKNMLQVIRLPDAVITFGKLKIVPEYGGVADDGYRVGFAGQLVLP